MSTIVVFVGARLGWSIAMFAMINVGLAAIWFGFVLLIGREHVRRSAEEPDQLAHEPI